MGGAALNADTKATGTDISIPVTDRILQTAISSHIRVHDYINCKVMHVRRYSARSTSGHECD